VAAYGVGYKVFVVNPKNQTQTPVESTSLLCLPTIELNNRLNCELSFMYNASALSFTQLRIEKYTLTALEKFEGYSKG
jgi:hypothetical protein